MSNHFYGLYVDGQLIAAMTSEARAQIWGRLLYGPKGYEVTPINSLTEAPAQQASDQPTQEEAES